MRKSRPSQRKLILKNGHAAGDIVVFTACVRDLHLSYPKRFITDVRTPCAEFWQNNPYLTSLDENEKGVEVIDCVPELIRECNQTPYHYIQAYTAFLSSHLKLPIKTAGFHGDIHLSDLEKSWYSQVHELTGEDTPFWIIVAGGKRDMTVKWWSTERYQQVVDHFRGRIQFVQVGELHDHHPPLHGVIDLRGRTDLRQLVRLVYHSQGVLCGVTCLSHLAAAVERKDSAEHNRPCVVVAGSREPPQWEAYPGQQFIHNVGMLACSGGGCWRSRVKPLGDGNELDQPVNICKDVVGDLPRCMDMITAADVIRRIEGYFEGGALNYLSSEQAQAAARTVVESPISSTKRPVLNGHFHAERNGERNRLVDFEPRDIPTIENGSSTPERLTLVSLSDDVMASVAKITTARLRAYADRQSYPFIHYQKLLDPSRPAAWNKLLAVRNALLSRQTEWVMWIDADAIVMNMDFPATRLIDSRTDLICASDHNGFNTGIFLMRYCDWSLRFLECTYFLGQVRADPDGYNPLWEQSTLKHLMRHFPEMESHIKVLPQAAMNSSMETYRAGDFIVHLSGLSNEDRLAGLSSLVSNSRGSLVDGGGARP